VTLKKQISEAESVIETDLVPKSLESDILGLSINEIKNKYPERYNAYIKILLDNTP